jgi:hypothetical protein
VSRDIDVYYSEASVDCPVDVWEETIGLEGLVQFCGEDRREGKLTTKALWARTSLL